jgi:signal transduction histidine kinase
MIFSASGNSIAFSGAPQDNGLPSSRFRLALPAFALRVLRAACHLPGRCLAWAAGGLILLALAPQAQAMTQLESAHATFELEGAAPVRPPSVVKLPYNWDRDIGGVSGKAEFVLELLAEPDGPQQALFIRRIGNAFEVAVNGRSIARVGAYGDLYSDTSVRPRLLVIPANLLQQRNVITITIGAISGRNAGVGVVYAGNLEEMREMYTDALRWRNSAYGVILVISLVLGSFTFLLWLRERDSIYLYYALSELLWAVHIAGIQFETMPIPFVWWGIVNYTCYAVSSGMICKFALTLVGRQSGILKRLYDFQLWLSLPVIVVAVLGNRPGLVSIWLGLTVLLGGAVGCVVIRQALRTGSVEQRVLAVATVITVSAAIHDMVMYRILPGYGGFPWLVFAWTALGMSMAWIIADRLHKSTLAVSRMNSTLAQRLAEREEELGRLFDSRAAFDRREAIVEERQRIMRDMHDGLGSQLVSAVHLIRDPNVSRGMLTEQLQDALDNLKMTVDAMQDTDGDIAMLLGALRYRLAPRLEAIGVSLSWDVRTLPPVAGWTIQNSRHLQLILFEAISNVIAHSGATQARLSAQSRQGEHGEEIWITLKDNGTGLQAGPASESGGQGLANMRSRATSIGAVIHFTSSAEGTQVQLALPVHRDGAARSSGAEAARSAVANTP